MDKVKVCIVLTEKRAVSGVMRDPGHILLEGICPKGITADNIDKAIQLGYVKAVTIASADDDKAEGSEKGSSASHSKEKKTENKK